MEYSIETRCQHLAEDLRKNRAYGAISYPIYQTSTFVHREVGVSTGYDYSRLQNPTREQLEKVVASLEKGKRAFAFSSGMAAITAVMELFSPGDHIIVEEDLYGGSIRLFHSINEKNGLSFTSADLRTEKVESYITKKTKAIFLETPSNPMMHIIDIEKIAQIARKYQLLLIVDNTFLSPYLLNPIEHGADIVVHSGTKYLGGHNDTLAGFLIARKKELIEKLEFIMKTTGACLAPFDSWLVLRGIKTLSVRIERAEENTKEIVKFLETQDKVKRVLYPGFVNFPGHQILKREGRGFGAVLTFEVDTKETAYHILNHVRVIQFAESLGGTESLITYPITQTHADLSEEERDKRGINECILRLSVGLENVGDLIADLKEALGES